MTAVPKPTQDPAADLTPDAPDAMKDAARGKEPKTRGAELSAVDYLLGPVRKIVEDVEVLYYTPVGEAKLTWRVHSLLGEEIEKWERECVEGEGADQRINERRLSAILVANATVHIEDESGKKTKPTDEDFRRTPSGDINPSAADALRGRFGEQEGVLMYLAQHIRRISGWSPDRVGNAQRVLVNATGN